NQMCEKLLTLPQSAPCRARCLLLGRCVAGSLAALRSWLASRERNQRASARRYVSKQVTALRNHLAFLDRRLRSVAGLGAGLSSASPPRDCNPDFHDCATYTHLVSFSLSIMIGGTKLCCSRKLSSLSRQRGTKSRSSYL